MEQDRNSEATVYIGNLDERVNDALVWELMIQAGPVVNVHLPKDRVSTSHQGFGFAEFNTVEDADYAVKVMNQVRLFGKPIRVNKASADKKHAVDIGAEVFVGNLDPSVDEKLLYDTFSAFGTLTKAPQISRDEQVNSKGYGFVSFDSFDASDAAIEAMNNQFLANQQIAVSYAFKQGAKGDRHGDQAERLLANQAKKNNYSLQEHLPNTPFAQAPGMAQPLTAPAQGTMPAPGPLPPGFQNQGFQAQQPPPLPAGFTQAYPMPNAPAPFAPPAQYGQAPQYR